MKVMVWQCMEACDWREDISESDIVAELFRKYREVTPELASRDYRAYAERVSKILQDITGHESRKSWAKPYILDAQR